MGRVVRLPARPAQLSVAAAAAAFLAEHELAATSRRVYAGSQVDNQYAIGRERWSRWLLGVLGIATFG